MNILLVLQDVKMKEKIGKGGEASVYSGTWLATPVAIKVLADAQDVDWSTASLENAEEYKALK